MDHPYYIILFVLWIISFILLMRTFEGRLFYFFNLLGFALFTWKVVLPLENDQRLGHFADGFTNFLIQMGWSFALLIIAAIKRGMEK